MNTASECLNGRRAFHEIIDSLGHSGPHRVTRDSYRVSYGVRPTGQAYGSVENLTRP
jgi:hypothetical protein